MKEESGKIDIPVRRTGNLKQYAIVLCRTEQATATSLSTSSQRGAFDYVEHAGQVSQINTIILHIETILILQFSSLYYIPV